MNPLFDLADDSVEDDFQKMLTDWESHIDSLQVHERIDMEAVVVSAMYLFK